MYTTKPIPTQAGFIMYKVLGKEYFFQFKTATRECLLNSERFTNRSTCLQQVVMVQKSASIDARYQRKTDAKGQHSFLLLNEDGITVGRSMQYNNLAGLEHAIAQLKQQAPRAAVQDLT